MKNKSSGIFIKVFSYTMLILVVVIGTTALIFLSQISYMLENSQQQQFSTVFFPLMQQIQGKSNEEAGSIAQAFHERNSSFEFSIRDVKGNIVYKTAGFKGMAGLSEMNVNNGTFLFRNKLTNKELKLGLVQNGTGFNLLVERLPSQAIIYKDLTIRTIITIIILLCLGSLCALLFARYIVRPVISLTRNTAKMANLEFVAAPVSRRDEIGQMESNVYRMYEQLKFTIKKLEVEVEREREMEENQRYFFMAASHELKTPIAAASALLEGMREGIIDVQDYPGNLQECLRVLNEQNKLINEILEIVHLDNGRLQLQEEMINLKETVSSVVQTYFVLAEAKGQSIQLEIPADLRIKIDIKMFRRVLSNIIMNAVQNTPEKGKIDIWSDNGPDFIRLSVLNSDSHIPEDILPKLFEPFYRTDKARSRSLGRSGLGLTIVKKALDQMGIKCAIENSGAGVLFRMEIPYSPNPVRLESDKS